MAEVSSLHCLQTRQRVTELDNQGVTRRRIHRFHTTAPPASIKWENVYAFNAGVNIV